MDSTVTQEILQKVRQVEIKTHRLVNDSLAGHYHSVFKGRGMSFDEVREYTPGDEVRTIDWNVTARTGEPFVKKYREERELTILLMIDVSRSEEFGSTSRSKREYIAELSSVLAFSALRNNDKVGLILFSDEVELYVPPAKGRSHVLRVIREILFFQPQGIGTDLTAPLEFASHVVKRRAVGFLISDFCLPGNQQDRLARLKPRLQSANRRHDIIALSVNDPREGELPDVGNLTLEDSETGEQVQIDTHRLEVREAYARITAERRSDLNRTIRSCGVDLLELQTDREYLPELLSFFNIREKRR